ncbi:tetratricopeptide repeat protein [Aureibaculum sp. A20]|uniref:Tetratricopeptide repeat protein n=1 Tax=Aureibaculum flavum TaxID=2795986 RepID=A0ABS0WQ90_9FLAO|nr:tetratricopeptide repeat protein [Aureibaculum flavum]MBJ2174148.1 tetratricopeptide repeat protein [Aureibaculum flavum]
MKHCQNWLLATIVFICSASSFAQKTEIYTHNLTAYNHAVDLYNNRDFVAAKHQFNSLKSDFDDISEYKANCAYYEAFSAIQIGERDGDKMMLKFVERFPTSTKQNTAFLEVGDYYFKNANYPYALKWYKRVETRNLSIKQEEDFNFKYAYGLFAVKSYEQAKGIFQKLLTSQEYGSQAKYYYGFIAYQDDDYDNADRYLGEVANDKELGDDVPYYMANIKFKTGQFQEAIDVAEPFLKKADVNERSEISKIIGESYFNLNKYAEAIPHLKNYKGKRRKWNNTDYYLLGYAYYKQNDYENAIANFNKIIGGENSVSQNAYYHLAECYLKTDLKTEALNAFRNASQMEFNEDIKKDAWLNYAKLSYEIGNPYKSVPDVLQEYLDLYPKSTAKDEIGELLISAYISSKDYAGALVALKGKNEAHHKDLYQKVALYRGIQLFNDGDYDDALTYFDLAIDSPRNTSTTAKAIFWKAETNYLSNNFKDALAGFQKFQKMNASGLPENEFIDYNIAYSYFKLKDYNRAGDEFQSFIDTNPDDENKLNDAYLRLGDAFYVSSNYNKAITAYNNVINKKGIDRDYAHFQRAMSYGFIRKNNAKIADFNAFLKAYPKSTLRDDVYYELGNSYVVADDNESALASYNSLLSEYKRSSYVPKALLKQGLIYYNIERDNEALDKYRRVVKEFPDTGEAKQAVANARQIYVDLGRVDEYAAWVKDLDFVTVTDSDLDNDMYESAEKQYLLNNRKKAISAFKSYLKEFPSGGHALNANFYLAEALFNEKQQTASIPYYNYVTDQERNEFTEQALSRLSQAYLEANNWTKAMPILKRLEEQADFPQNITFAQSNLMKGYYEQENYDAAVAYAEKVLLRPKLENRVKSDAKVIIARSAIKTGDERKAEEAYIEVGKIATGELKAESIYYDAYFKHQEGNYKVSNTTVQTLVADYSAYKYYGAKGLIVMAKNFYELQDAYQATYILESVIKNFSDYKDVTDEAKSELSKIKKKEAETNESVNPDN